MTKFIKDLQDARSFLEGYYIEAGELSGDALQNLDDHIMDQISGPRCYEKELVDTLENLMNQHKDLQTAITITLDSLHEIEFKALAKFVLDNKELFNRKTSDKEIQAYEDGDDEYGDIVFWAERQLEAADDAYDICEESGEVPSEWFEEEVAVLRRLIDENRRGA